VGPGVEDAGDDAVVGVEITGEDDDIMEIMPTTIRDALTRKSSVITAILNLIPDLR